MEDMSEQCAHRVQVNDFEKIDGEFKLDSPK